MNGERMRSPFTGAPLPWRGAPRHCVARWCTIAHRALYCVGRAIVLDAPQAPHIITASPMRSKPVTVWLDPALIARLEQRRRSSRDERAPSFSAVLRDAAARGLDADDREAGSDVPAEPSAA